MIELSNTQQALEAQIADEQAKTILPLKEARVISFLKNYTEIVECADKTESLDNMKRLFDVFIKEVIFDGERFLIVMKTTNEPLDPEKRQKEEATRKKFELLRFGDPIGYPPKPRRGPLGGASGFALARTLRLRRSIERPKQKAQLEKTPSGIRRNPEGVPSAERRASPSREPFGFAAPLSDQNKKHSLKSCAFCFGDPIGTRTRVTAVKGRCLNRLTMGPSIYTRLPAMLLSGSGGGIRTYDLSGMNRSL